IAVQLPRADRAFAQPKAAALKIRLPRAGAEGRSYCDAVTMRKTPVRGRSEDLIVVAGRNLYPHDIERAAERVDGVRRGCVIAVRVDAEQEGFTVLAEVHNADHDDPRMRIRRAITKGRNQPRRVCPALGSAVPARNAAQDRVGQVAQRQRTQTAAAVTAKT